MDDGASRPDLRFAQKIGCHGNDPYLSESAERLPVVEPSHAAFRVPTNWLVRVDRLPQRQREKFPNAQAAGGHIAPFFRPNYVGK